MRGAIKDQIKWQRAIILMYLNPDAPRVKIGREVGYTGQMVGVIARAIGLPPGKAGGFQKKDNEPLQYPPGWFKTPDKLNDEERTNMKEILEKACVNAPVVSFNVEKAPLSYKGYSWKRPIWMEGKEEAKAE